MNQERESGSAEATGRGAGLNRSRKVKISIPLQQVWRKNRHEGSPETIMDKFVIRGGNPLVGTLRVSGAKNAALPAMAAAILTDEPVILENIPDVRDIQTER